MYTNKKTPHTKGFTLIELLVVIAIIGILAAVVLASLQSARSKGADAAIKSDMDNMRAEATLFYDSNGSSPAVSGYTSTGATGVVTSSTTKPTNTTSTYSLLGDAQFWQQISQIASLSNSNVISHVVYNIQPTSYMIGTDLTSVSNQSWCVDSLGNSKLENQKAGLYSGLTACP